MKKIIGIFIVLVLFMGEGLFLLEAGRMPFGTLELTNRANKSVSCRTVKYVNNRRVGEYWKMGAIVTAAPGQTRKGNKSFALYSKVGAICWFTKDYPRSGPNLNRINQGNRPFHRTDHFTTRPHSIIMLTAMSNLSNVTVSDRAGKAPRQATPGRSANRR